MFHSCTWRKSFSGLWTTIGLDVTCPWTRQLISNRVPGGCSQPWPWTKHGTALKQVPIEIPHREMTDHTEGQKQHEFDYKPITICYKYRGWKKPIWALQGSQRVVTLDLPLSSGASYSWHLKYQSSSSDKHQWGRRWVKFTKRGKI